MSAVIGSSRAGSRRPRRRKKIVAFGVLALAISLVLPHALSAAATAPTLGTAASFAVLGSTTVTNTGPSVIDGDLGVSPGDAVTGFQGVDAGPGVVNGEIHAGDEVARQAQEDAAIAYTNLANQACAPGNDLTGTDLVGLTLTAGVYCFSSSAQLSGTLTLDAEGDPDAVFVFQIGSSLTTASNSRVLVTNSTSACNVFWQVGSAATLGTGTDFVGTVLAGTEAISALTDATVIGRLVSLAAAVTLDSNLISTGSCTGGGGGGGTGGVTGGGGTGGVTGGGVTGGVTAPIGDLGTDQASPSGSETAGEPDAESGTADGYRAGERLPETGANGVLAVIGGLAVVVGTMLSRLSTRFRRTECS